MQAYSVLEYYQKQTPNQTFKGVLKISWKTFVMEFLWEKFQAYKLQSLSLHVFKIPENSWNNVCYGIPFYRSRWVQVFYRIAVLNSFLRSSQVYLKRTPTWMFYWEVTKNILSGYFYWNANGWVLLKIQTSICLEHQWTPLNWWVGNCREMNRWVRNCREMSYCI